MPPSLGETVFKNRREYPLAKKTGTRDYVFDFVPGKKDDYGEGARAFFKRHYKDHRDHQVGSLEALVAVLANDVRNAGVTHIREIVIVSHGTPHGLLLNVVNGVTATQHKKYKNVMAKSLLDLQTELSQFQSFANNRKTMIGALTDDSWVTVRACNFGQSRGGLYALYAFFGGRANVYCPRIYQFFGKTPVGPGARFANRLDVHQHWVKQGFIPGHIHTPGRGDAVVQFLADRSGFTAPLEITSVGMDGIVESLDKGLISDVLATKLDAAGVSLTATKLAQARPVKVLEAGARWAIVDLFTHPNPAPQKPTKYAIEYQLTRHHITPTVLVVEARPIVKANLESVPLQLFFDDYQNKVWQGHLAELAGHVEPTVSPEFQALQTTLNAIGNTEVTLPQGLLAALTDLFDVVVTPATTIKRVAPGRPHGPGRIDWLLTNQADQREYLIKLLHPHTREGAQAHTFAIFEHYSDEDRAAERATEKLVYMTGSPDQPGTELMAYLDTQPIDSLTALIDWLNAPYEPEHVIYLHHAVQALARKHEFGPWLASRPEFAAITASTSPLALLDDPYTNLSLSQGDDLRQHAHDFSSNAVWAEVKASREPRPAFQTDLFTEHPLTFAADELFLLDDLAVDSPGAALGPDRAVQSAALGIDLPFEKTVYEPLPQDTEALECERFAQLVDVVKSMPNKSVDEIDAAVRALKLHAGPDTPSLTDLTFYGMPKPIDTIMDILDVLGDDPGGIFEKAVVWAGAKFPEGSLLSRSMVAGASWRTTGLLVHLTRALPYITLIQFVGEIFHNYLAEFANALERTKQVGKIVAVRQWAVSLWVRARTLQKDFPTEVDIDLGTDMQKLYDTEIGFPATTSFNLIFNLDAFTEGFEDGVRLIRSHTNFVLFDANKIIDETLLRAGLTPCMIRTLWAKGIIHPGRARAIVMEQFADLVLERTPDI